jgi:hypothetical protein
MHAAGHLRHMLLILCVVGFTAPFKQARYIGGQSFTFSPALDKLTTHCRAQLLLLTNPKVLNDIALCMLWLPQIAGLIINNECSIRLGARNFNGGSCILCLLTTPSSHLKNHHVHIASACV